MVQLNVSYSVFLMFCSSFIIFQSVVQLLWNLELELGMYVAFMYWLSGEELVQGKGDLGSHAYPYRTQNCHRLPLPPLEAVSPGPHTSWWICRASVHCGIRVQVTDVFDRWHMKIGITCCFPILSKYWGHKVSEAAGAQGRKGCSPRPHRAESYAPTRKTHAELLDGNSKRKNLVTLCHLNGGVVISIVINTVLEESISLKNMVKLGTAVTLLSPAGVTT